MAKDGVYLNFSIFEDIYDSIESPEMREIVTNEYFDHIIKNNNKNSDLLPEFNVKDEGDFNDLMLKLEKSKTYPAERIAAMRCYYK